MPKSTTESGGDKKKKMGGLRALLFGAGALTAAGAAQPAEVADATASSMPEAVSLGTPPTPAELRLKMLERDMRMDADQVAESKRYWQEKAAIDANVSRALTDAQHALDGGTASVNRVLQQPQIPPNGLAEEVPNTPIDVEKAPLNPDLKL